MSKQVPVGSPVSETFLFFSCFITDVLSSIVIISAAFLPADIDADIKAQLRGSEDARYQPASRCHLPPVSPPLKKISSPLHAKYAGRRGTPFGQNAFFALLLLS
jgi:hypothetical protein